MLFARVMSRSVVTAVDFGPSAITRELLADAELSTVKISSISLRSNSMEDTATSFHTVELTLAEVNLFQKNGWKAFSLKVDRFMRPHFQLFDGTWGVPRSLEESLSGSCTIRYIL
jgi:hypothetical protein